MRFRPVLLTAAALFVFAGAAGAQTITNDVLTAFLRGREAEKPELEKVGGQLEEIDQKAKDYRSCAAIINETMSGLKAKVALKAKCGATSEDGFRKDRERLMAAPERAGAAAAGMELRQYVKVKELVTMYLSGNRNFAEGELAAFAANASALSNAMGMALLSPTGSQSAGPRRGGAGRAGSAAGNAMAGRMAAAFTPDMTWAYVGYLWNLMYMSGATMFETDYSPGQWTTWEISDTSQPEQKLTMERALLSRAADKSEWWRIKTITATPERTDTITLETQFKPLDDQGMTMQVVRMRGKLPGDAEPQELMVPQSLSMLSMAAFPMKPTPESVAGATVGNENVRVGSSSFNARHVRFGAGGGTMNWWLADNAPGTLVKVEMAGQDNQKWTMVMTAHGTGAKSELGVK